MAEDHDGSDRCVLEVDGNAAGILLREEDGAYQFFAANPGRHCWTGNGFDRGSARRRK